MYACAPFMCLAPALRGRRGFQTGGIDGCEPARGCWESNAVLTTETSLRWLLAFFTDVFSSLICVSSDVVLQGQYLPHPSLEQCSTAPLGVAKEVPLTPSKTQQLANIFTS